MKWVIPFHSGSEAPVSNPHMSHITAILIQICRQYTRVLHPLYLLLGYLYTQFANLGYIYIYIYLFIYSFIYLYTHTYPLYCQYANLHAVGFGSLHFGRPTVCYGKPTSIDRQTITMFRVVFRRCIGIFCTSGSKALVALP